MTVAMEVCLAVAVLCAAVGCVGFVRLATPLDRLHCSTFVSASAGFAIVVASLFADGLSTRSLKLIALLVFTLLAGAAMVHASGRALWLRDGPKP